MSSFEKLDKMITEAKLRRSTDRKEFTTVKQLTESS
jgi:hypothetical protein